MPRTRSYTSCLISRYTYPVRGSTSATGCFSKSSACSWSSLSSIMACSFAASYLVSGVQDKASRPLPPPVETWRLRTAGTRRPGRGLGWPREKGTHPY